MSWQGYILDMRTLNLVMFRIIIAFLFCFILNLLNLKNSFSLEISVTKYMPNKTKYAYMFDPMVLYEMWSVTEIKKYFSTVT